jgi:signal transduction histidine kinase
LLHLPWRDATGQITGLVQVVEDVSALGAVQQSLSQHRNELRLLRDRLARQNLSLEAANAELRHLDEMKSRFVSSAAHELRAPLAAMRGYVELLRDEAETALTAGQREYLAVVERGITRLLVIISNLLDITRIEAGRVDLLLRPTDLANLIQSAVAEQWPQLEAKRLDITLDLPAALPHALCDETRAAQIMTNLLSNAIKYTPDGGRITISLQAVVAEGALRLAVSDTGVGIPPADQAQLFSRFFRAATASLTGATGAGLGLYISRLLVELHGGRIWLESEPGRGSTFYVTFLCA